MHSVRIELAKLVVLIIVGTRITYQAPRKPPGMLFVILLVAFSSIAGHSRYLVSRRMTNKQ